jgi:hypothetical protein
MCAVSRVCAIKAVKDSYFGALAPKPDFNPEIQSRDPYPTFLPNPTDCRQNTCMTFQITLENNL